MQIFCLCYHPSLTHYFDFHSTCKRRHKMGLSLNKCVFLQIESAVFEKQSLPLFLSSKRCLKRYIKRQHLPKTQNYKFVLPNRLLQ